MTQEKYGACRNGVRKAKATQSWVWCRYVDGGKGFDMSSKGKTKENVHLLLNGHSPWSQRIWEGLRYLMSCFASERQVISAFSNLKPLQPGGKCGAMKTFSVDNNGVKEHLWWTHTGTWDQTGCNRECWGLMSLQANCLYKVTATVRRSWWLEESKVNSDLLVSKRPRRRIQETTTRSASPLNTRKHFSVTMRVV